MSENIARWLRLARTRRMFARALGGGEHPNETYLSMATTMLDAVATEWANVPWAEAAEAVAQALTPERLSLFAKRLLAELPRCTGCDFDHGWDDHVQAIFASTEELRDE